MSATDFIEKCLVEHENPTLFSNSFDFCSLAECEIVDAFIRICQTNYKLNIVPWTPNNSAYPRYMLLGGDRGILAYIRFIYIESPATFAPKQLSIPSFPVLQTIAKAESHLDRPVFFIYFINVPDKCEMRFETNEQIKDRWLSSGFSSSVYCPVYEEMGDANNLLAMWNNLKKNSVRFY